MSNTVVKVCGLFQVTAVRRETRLEKKKLAMAMRMKQLGDLGMSVCLLNIVLVLLYLKFITFNFLDSSRLLKVEK
jgi:hypothetical protein